MRREKFCLDRAIFNFISSQQIEFLEIPQVVFCRFFKKQNGTILTAIQKERS